MAVLKPRKDLSNRNHETRLAAFINEREAIRVRRFEEELPAPWTLDPTLQTYRFCNVRREEDKVTRWLAKNWRAPNAADPDLWFAMTVARHVNLPDTLAAIGYPVPWDGANFVQVMAARKRKRMLSYNGAYMIRAKPGRRGTSKARYLRDEVFDPMWSQRERLRPRPGDTLNGFHVLLGQFYGVGSFMTGQVVADIKYAGALSGAIDWWTFACSGPGSRRGLNLALGWDVNSPWTEEEWRFEMGRLHERVAPMIADEVGRLHAQDFQNCLCEFSKWEKARLGIGRPKQLYEGGRG